MRSLKIYLIVAASLLLVYVVVQYNRPRQTNWTPTFINTDKMPLGTYIAYNRIADIFPKTSVSARRKAMFEVLSETHGAHTAYIIINNRIEPSETDVEQLKKFVQAGNEVFIAAESFGSVIEKEFKTSTERLVDLNKPEYIRLVNPVLDAEHQYFIDKGVIDNRFTAIDTTRTTVLGVDDEGRSNFIRYNLGKGAVYFAANPKVFTNYSLLKPQGAQYAAYALSYLKKPGKVLWDEYYSQGSEVEGSPVRVFLTTPSLQWAYYIALFGMLLFVLYEVKRRQRIIPVIEPLANTTLEFVNVVGQVYYEQRDNTDIAYKKIMYFLTTLRDERNLRTNKLDDEFIIALAKKTGIAETFARELVDYMSYITHQDRVTDRELLELNKLIEKFYTLSA